MFKKRLPVQIASAVIVGLMMVASLNLTPVYAEEKTEKIVTLDKVKNLGVNFNYPTEIVDIVFVSPSGNEFTKDSKEVEYTDGDLWRKYKIVNAEAGDWSVKYDKGKNEEIQWSIIDYEDKDFIDTSEDDMSEDDMSDVEAENVVTPEPTPEVTVAPTPNTGLESTPGVNEVAESGQSEAELTRWDISEKQPRTKTFTMPIPSNTVRLEIFYTAQAPAPDITFTSTSGYVYKSTMENYVDGETMFMVRKNLEVADYSDIKYMVIYISQPKDPGKWQMTVTLDKATEEMFIIQSKTPENWKDLKVDYKTAPLSMLTWAIDEATSAYYASDIVKIVAKDDQIPEINNIQPTDPPKKESVDPFILGFIIIIIAIIFLVVVIFLQFSKKKTEDINKRSNMISKANKKFRDRQKKENNNLDNVLNEFASEYTDDLDDYISSDEKSEEQKEKIPVSVQPFTIEQTQAAPTVESMPSNNQSVSSTWTDNTENASVVQLNKQPANEIPVQEKTVPDWMPKPEKKTPSWMSSEQKNNQSSYF